jgi:hypothetical protein
MEGLDLFFVTRKMLLEGRVNLIFEDLGGSQTRVTANTRYSVTKQTEARHVQGTSQNLSDTISFNSGGVGTFPTPNPNLPATECIPTGKLEQDILSNIK